MPEEAEKQVRFQAHPLSWGTGLGRQVCLGGWHWAPWWGRVEESTGPWGPSSGQELLLRAAPRLGLSSARTPASVASRPAPGSTSDTPSTFHNEVWGGELRSGVTGDLTLPLHRAAAVESQLLPLDSLSSGATTPAWDKGKPLTGLGGPGSCEPWSYSWVLWVGGGSGAWVVLGFTMPILLGTAGFRLPLKLVLSVTLTGTAIYQVCPASVVPFASGPLLPTPSPEMT